MELTVGTKLNFSQTENLTIPNLPIIFPSLFMFLGISLDSMFSPNIFNFQCSNWQPSNSNTKYQSKSKKKIIRVSILVLQLIEHDGGRRNWVCVASPWPLSLSLRLGHLQETLLDPHPSLKVLLLISLLRPFWLIFLVWVLLYFVQLLSFCWFTSKFVN